MRRVFNWIVFGALVGVAVATAFAPIVLRTLLASTGAKDAMCQCVELVDNTARLLIKTQVWGLVIGAVLFPIAAWAIRRAWNKLRAARALPPQQASTAEGPNNQ